MTLVYTAACMVVVMGFLSLSVDYGRARCAKTELQNAVDAAARYASTGVADGTTLAKAQAAANENKVDGSPLSIQASDVEVGVWNSTTRAFTATSTNPNAVRITGRRSASRGTAVPTMFASPFGRNTVDVSAQSVARYTGSTGSADIVGLSSVNISGSGLIRRWASESGTVNVASNGTYTLSWGQYIYGNVLYRGSAPNPPAPCITGTKTAMSSNIAYATPTVPGGAVFLGNNITYGNGQTYNMPGGTYYTTGTLDIGGGATVNISGNVNVYCSGNVTFGNGCILNANTTTNKLTIYMINSSSVSFNMSSNTYMRVYAPLSTVNVTGSTPFIGSIVANNLVINGSANVNYSSAMASPVAPTGGGLSGAGNISMVK